MFFAATCLQETWISLRLVRPAHANTKKALSRCHDVNKIKNKEINKVDKDIWLWFWLHNAKAVSLGCREKELWHSFCIPVAGSCSRGSQCGRTRVKQPQDCQRNKPSSQRTTYTDQSLQPSVTPLVLLERTRRSFPGVETDTIRMLTSCWLN